MGITRTRRISNLESRISVGLVLLWLGGCGGEPLVEIDGDRIRAQIAEIGRRSTGGPAAERDLLELVRRSERARELIFREADRARRAAALRAAAALEEERVAGEAGRSLSAEEQAALAHAVALRIENDAAREALDAFLRKLP
jgi:hypothetical protein